tara:strand:- start:16686 stop:16934 length:249 start_codon:yes stop_codon:yes gene_type:complete
MKDLNKFEAEQLLHLAQKIVDYGYINEYEHYWETIEDVGKTNEMGGMKNTEDWLDQDKLNKSNHIFKYFYALDKFINNLNSK